MGNTKFVDNMIESKLMNLHTAYLAKVLSVKGTTAKIQPLGNVKAYGESAKSQSVLSAVPIIESARTKIKKDGKSAEVVTGVSATVKKTKKKVKDVNDKEIEVLTDVEVTITPTKSSVTMPSTSPIAKGDIVICVCCERDITDAKRGSNSTPVIGSRHSMSNSVIVGVL